MPDSQVEEGTLVPQHVTKFSRALPWLLLVGGLVGLIVSFVLAVTTLRVIGIPGYRPSCDLVPFSDCHTVLAQGARIFGAPGSFIGIIWFPVVMTVGALAMSTSLKRWFWLAFNAGTALGFAVALGFTVQNLSVLGAVCGCSLLVLAIVFAIFLYTTLFNLSAGNIAAPAGLTARVSALHILLLLAGYAVIGLFVSLRLS